MKFPDCWLNQPVIYDKRYHNDGGIKQTQFVRPIQFQFVFTKGVNK